MLVPGPSLCPYFRVQGLGFRIWGLEYGYMVPKWYRGVDGGSRHIMPTLGRMKSTDLAYVWLFGALGQEF